MMSAIGWLAAQAAATAPDPRVESPRDRAVRVALPTVRSAGRIDLRALAGLVGCSYSSAERIAQHGENIGAWRLVRERLKPSAGIYQVYVTARDRD